MTPDTPEPHRIALTTFPPKGAALVVGDRGGIGSAVATALRESGAFIDVIGANRADGCDLLDEATIVRLARRCDLGPPLRLVLVCTGLLHDAAMRPEKALRDLDPVALARAFAVNATGPALLMKHLLPRLPRDGKAVFAVLSARVGSIGDNRLGGWYAYRASKAALNQLVRTAAVELRRTHPHATCVALHPGTVDTALSAPFGAGSVRASPAEAAARLLAVVERLQPADSGGFLDWAGQPVPW